MLGHAPVILPALARVKLDFGWAFYIPLMVLHASLFVRLFFGPITFSLLGWGAVGNASAIVLFVMTMAGSAVAWRVKHTTSTNRHAIAPRH